MSKEKENEPKVDIDAFDQQLNLDSEEEKVQEQIISVTVPESEAPDEPNGIKDRVVKALILAK